MGPVLHTMTRHLPMSIRPSGPGPGARARMGTCGASRQRRCCTDPHRSTPGPTVRRESRSQGYGGGPMVHALRTRRVRISEPVGSYVLARMGRPTCALHPCLGMRSPSASSATISQARLSTHLELDRMRRLRGSLDRQCCPMPEMRSCGHTSAQGHLRASGDACGVSGGIPRSLPFERTDDQCLLAAGDRCHCCDTAPR